MQSRTQILSISVALLLVVVIWRLIHKRRLREEHSLLWLLAGLVLLGLSINRGALSAIARLFHVGYPPTLLLSTGLLFAVMIQLSHSVTISNLSRKNRDLAQEVAMLRLLLEENQGQDRMDRMSGVLKTEWPEYREAEGVPTLHDVRDEWPKSQLESVSEEMEALA